MLCVCLRGNEREECVYGCEEWCEKWYPLTDSLTYGSENWTWNGEQQSRVCAAEMSFLRGECV